MSELEKLKERLKLIPKDFTYNEAKTLLNKLGFAEFNKGKTSGSRVKFQKNNISILLHKPHPNNEMKKVYVKQLLEFLTEIGEIKWGA